MREKHWRWNSNQFITMLLDIRIKYEDIMFKKQKREVDKFWKRPDVKRALLEDSKKYKDKLESGQPVPIEAEIYEDENGLIKVDPVYTLGGYRGRPKGAKDVKPRIKRKTLPLTVDK